MACNWQLRCDETENITLRWNNLIPVACPSSCVNINFNKKFDWRGILPNATHTLMFLFSATEDRNKNGVSFNNED